VTGGAGAFRHRGRRWLAVAAVALAAAAAAVVPVPDAIAGNGSPASAFAALASAAIVTLVILPFLVWPAAARPRVWVVVALCALAAGLAAFPVSGYAEATCTAGYGGRRIVIGTELTPLGAAYQRENPELSTDDLLFDAAGVPERVWTRSSITRCAVTVHATYFLWIPFLVICLVATAQAVPSSILAPARRKGAIPAAPADAAPEYDVFISYRHGGEDQRFARELVAFLERDGYRVAIDERDFAANASFLQEMERAIRRSRFTVAIVSARYLESGHTEEEAILTKVLDMADRKRRLVPVIIEKVAMPAWLYGLVGIDWTRDDPIVDPFDRLRATLGSPLST
jgi:hypothetical protein